MPSQGEIWIPGNGASSSATVRVAAVDVPEPASALLMGVGLLSLSLLRRRAG